MEVRAKKHLGQHFLVDKNTADKIASAVMPSCDNMVEIGPGMGVLTSRLRTGGKKLKAIEIDSESVAYLKTNTILEVENIIESDFLKMDLTEIFDGQEFAVVGNFPYNISSQILFKVIENRHLVPEFAGMFQKEVALRIAEKPGTKEYGILSVMTQAYYDASYLFTVNETVFSPPPKVKSGVIKLVRKPNFKLPCDEAAFHKIVKTSFNQRRKMLRVSLRQIFDFDFGTNDIFNKRPEQLHVNDFVLITNILTR